jgi:hypothetical protein
MLPRAAAIAENLFLRKQLALVREREVKPRHSTARCCSIRSGHGHA